MSLSSGKKMFLLSGKGELSVLLPGKKSDESFLGFMTCIRGEGGKSESGLPASVVS
jgi:hypothetical protein